MHLQSNAHVTTITAIPTITNERLIKKLLPLELQSPLQARPLTRPVFALILETNENRKITNELISGLENVIIRLDH